MLMTCTNCGHLITHCNHCGRPIDIEGQLDDDRLIKTLAALRYIQRQNGGKASTKAVATRISYSDRWTREFLNRLSDIGLVERHGRRKGWSARPIATQSIIVVEFERAAA